MRELGRSLARTICIRSLTPCSASFSPRSVCSRPFLVFLSGVCLHAQAPIVEEPNYTPTLTFDVASIRLAPPPDANFHVSVSSPPHSSRFEATNLQAQALGQQHTNRVPLFQPDLVIGELGEPGVGSSSERARMS
jgi:hypothetical protein